MHKDPNAERYEKLRQILAEAAPARSTPLTLYLDANARRIRLCRLGEHDLGALAEMYSRFDREQVSFGLPPRGAERIQTWLRQLFEADVQLIAKHNKSVVAHAAWVKDSPGSAEVLVFVAPKYQGVGLGKKMLMAVVTMARFMGIELLWAEVEAKNSRMIHVNHELGFHTIALHQGSRQMTLEP